MNDFKYKPKHVVVKKKYTYIALAPALKQYRRGRLLTLYVQSPFPAPLPPPPPPFDLFGEFMNGSWYPKGRICHLMYSFYRPPRPFPQK